MAVLTTALEVSAVKTGQRQPYAPARTNGQPAPGPRSEPGAIERGVEVGSTPMPVKPFHPVPDPGMVVITTADGRTFSGPADPAIPGGQARLRVLGVSSSLEAAIARFRLDPLRSRSGADGRGAGFTGARGRADSASSVAISAPWSRLSRAQMPADAPPNDFCANPIAMPTTVVNGTALSPVVDLMDATVIDDPTNGPGAAFRTSRSVWFAFTTGTNPGGRSGTYYFETCNTATTLPDPVIGIYWPYGGANCGISLGTNDDLVLAGTGFDTCRHGARASVGVSIGGDGTTTFYVGVWKFGLEAPEPGKSSVQLRVIEQYVGTRTPTPTPTFTSTPGPSATAATPTNTPTDTRTPTVTNTPTNTPTVTNTPTAVGPGDAIYAYAKRYLSGSLGANTVMHLRKTTAGMPAYSGCVTNLFPPSIECDDDDGHTYVSPANVVLPPPGGGHADNSGLAGVPVGGDELIVVQGSTGATIIGPYDLVIHRPDGSGNFDESENNDTLAAANPVPTLPPCSAVYSSGTGNQRPLIPAGSFDSVGVPTASAGWVGSGGFGSGSDVDYYGPFQVGSSEAIYIGVDGSLDCAGCPHDLNGINADISFDLVNASGSSIPGSVINGSASTTVAGQGTSEHFLGTPGQTFYLKINAAVAADAGKGYRFSACSLGSTAGNTPTPTATQNPLLTWTPTPTWTSSPTSTPLPNDTCAGAVPLLLNIPAIGSLAGARNDYQLPALAACFTANGEIGNPTPAAVTALGRDLVYAFTAPSSGRYSFRLANIDPAGGANILLHLASDCPAAQATATPATPAASTPTPNVLPACRAAANRNSTGTYAAEEVMCIPMTAGETLYAYVDEVTYSASQTGGRFSLEVTECLAEEEPNDAWEIASLFACGVEGRIIRTPSPTGGPTSTATPTITPTYTRTATATSTSGPSPTAPTPTPTRTPTVTWTPTRTQTPSFGENDWFGLPTAPSSEYRLFALVDAGAANSNDVDVRFMTGGDTLEFDGADNDTLFGASAPNLGGALYNVTPQPANFLRVNAPSTSSTLEPYRVFAVVQPPRPTAVVETEPNNSPAQANFHASGYFYGVLEGRQPEGNNMVGTGASVDVDYYRFSATAGDLIFVSIDGDPRREEGSFGKSPINPMLVLLDAGGNVLLQVNETSVSTSYGSGLGQMNATVPQGGQAEGLYFRAPYSGTYHVGVAAADKTVTQGVSGRHPHAGDYLLSISLNCQTGLQLQETETPTPSATATRTATATASFTPSRTPTPTASFTPAASDTPTALPTDTPTPTATTTFTPAVTSTATATEGPTPRPTATRPVQPPLPVGGVGMGRIGRPPPSLQAPAPRGPALPVGLAVLGLLAASVVIGWRGRARP